MKTLARIPSRRSAAVSLAAALILSSQAFAQITVTTLTDENDLPAGAQVSLREALRDIADGGLITFDASLAGGALVLTFDELLVPGKTVTVDAPGGLVIDGRWLSRIFQVGSGAGLNLTGVTLQHGRPPVGGGGAILSSGTLTLTDCVLRDNRAVSGAAGTPGVPRVSAGGNAGPGGPGTDGGAIHNTGSLSALRCHFIDNIAGNGGHGGNGGNSLGGSFQRGGEGGFGGRGGSGGAILNAGPLQLMECIFAGNKSGAGGAGGTPGEPTYRSCGSNGGDSGSGGAVRQNGILTVDRCTFHGNSSPSGALGYPSTAACGGYGYTGVMGSGAAVSCSGGSAALTNSTFVANQLGFGGSFVLGSGPGGAIHAAAAVPLRLVHCTVTQNSAVSPFPPPSPGGAFDFYSPQPPQTAGIAGSPQCENCVVSGNTVTDHNPTQEKNFSPGVPPVLIPANSPGTTAGVNLQLSPLSITSSALPVLVPGAASPALDAGAVLTDPPATDQRGLPRAAGVPDLGAVEVQESEPAPRTPQAITFSAPEVALSSSVTLTALVESGLPVLLEQVSGPATLNGNTLTFTGVGFAAVRASQSGDATRAPALPLVRIIESPRTQTIPFTPAASYVVYPGSESMVTLPATTSAGLPVTWTFVGAPAPGFSLSGNIVTTPAVGSVKVRGRNPGNAEHSTLDSTWSLTFVAGSVRWDFPAGNQYRPLFTFVEGSPHGMLMTAFIDSPHTSPLTVPVLPGGLVATPSILPAGQTSVHCLITLPANPQLFTQELIIGEPDISTLKFCLANRASIPLKVVTPPTVPSGARAQVEVSCPEFLPFTTCPFVNLGQRSVAVSAVDFDYPAISVPVTVNSVTNGAGTNPKKHLTITFPPMDRRVKLKITTDDGITGVSGPIQVISDTNTDGDGINDIVETALQRPTDQIHPPPLTIERDATGLHAVLASRPLNLEGWTVAIELSTDLQTWAPAPAAATTMTPNPGGTTERVSVLLPTRPEQHFVRLRVTGP